MTTNRKTEVSAESEDTPNLFRVNIRVGNLDEAADFYGRLLGQSGRKQAGERCYFTCGTVTLQVNLLTSKWVEVSEPAQLARCLQPICHRVTTID